MAAQSLPSHGPKRGRTCYVTPTFSGVPNAKRGEEIRNGYLTLAFSGAQKRAGLLRNPSVLGVPNQKGTKSELVASPLASRGPKRGRNCYATLHSRGSPTPSAATKSREATSPLPPPGPKRGWKCYVTLHSWGSPNEWGQNQKWLSHPCLLMGKKREELLRNPYILGDPQTKGDKIRSGDLTPPFSGAKRGRNCYVKPTFLGIPKQTGTKSEVATSPLPSRGLKQGGIAT